MKVNWDILNEIINKNILANSVYFFATEKCNYTCKHCAHSCSPKKSAKYVSNEYLSRIVEIAKSFINNGGCSITIGGGEPTINLNEFERIIEFIMPLVEDSAIKINMVTNGWWLFDNDTCRKFLRIVAPYVLDGYESSLTVSVSNDIHHKKFHPKHIPDIAGLIKDDGFWFDIINQSSYVCLNCEHENAEFFDICPKCDSEEIEENYIYDRRLSLFSQNSFNSNDSWIFAHSSENNDIVYPSGRGKKIATFDCSRYCFNNTLQYDISGNVVGFCCRGLQHPLGTLEDDPVILSYAISYMLEISKSEKSFTGYDCKKYFYKEWIKSGSLQEIKKIVGKHLENSRESRIISDVQCA